MASTVALREDFTAARMRALARSSRDANQVRRLLALARIYEGGTRSEAAQHGGATVGGCRACGLSVSG
jgi:histidyl-tRNA synthetase